MVTASAVLLKAAGEGLKGPDGKEVIRPYTPVSTPDTAGHIDFLIKRYVSVASLHSVLMYARY